MAQKALGPEVCYSFPLIYAITGCDTTSRLFGVGKGAALKKLQSNSNFKKQAKVFSGEATKDEIISACKEPLICLYGGQSEDWLDALRYRRFQKKTKK